MSHNVKCCLKKRYTNEILLFKDFSINLSFYIYIYFFYLTPDAARIQLITSDLEDCSLSAVSITSGAESWTFICMF